METTQPLLQDYIMGDIKLNNRVVMAPMTRCRADNPGNVATDLMAEYYAQRASAGLIISEGSQISKRAVGYINTPGIHSDAQVEGWKNVTAAVHARGGKMFIQLWHVGRISHPDFHNGELPLSASAINPHSKCYTADGFKETVTPKAMALDEIKETITDFGQAAKNAMAARFDGVEIHASNGYLLHQFFSRTSRSGFTRETGHNVIADDLADLVAFGKPFVSNPALVERFRPGIKTAEGDEDTFYIQGSAGYTDYPRA